MEKSLNFGSRFISSTDTVESSISLDSVGDHEFFTSNADLSGATASYQGSLAATNCSEHEVAATVDLTEDLSEQLNYSVKIISPHVVGVQVEKWEDQNSLMLKS